MNIRKIGLALLSLIALLYVLFLLVPFCLTGLVNSYNDEISKAVEESSGFKLKLDKIRIVTTPKLTAGLKVGELVLIQPDGEEFLAVTNAEAKLSLLPLLVKRIEADVIKADDFTASFKIQADGSLLIEKYLPEAEAEGTEAPVTELPFGFKLSNRFPDVRVKEYSLSVVDMRTDREYSLVGSNFKITDFILNKKLKVSASGSIKLADTTPFTYNIKLFNKIMPDMDVNDLIFAQAPAENSQAPEMKDVVKSFIDILEGIKSNRLGADLVVDLKTKGNPEDIHLDGVINVQNLTLAVNGVMLPKSHCKLDFQGKKLITDIGLYVSDNEVTTILGELKGGNSKKINLAFKSNVQINNLFNILKSVASSFGYNDLNTLAATGKIDADFKIKSDMKKVVSDGYFKIPSATVKYPLYNVYIDKINADADFAGDSLNLKNFGFEIFSQPLRAYGTVKNDTNTDLHLVANKLSVKGLLAVAGQLALLKDNDIKSGTVSMDASVVGKLKDLKPEAMVSVENLNILNKPSMIGVKLPQAKITLDTQDVNIGDTYVLLNNSRIDIGGKISDYMTKKLAVNLKAQGNLIASDLKMMVPADMRSMIAAKGAMPLLVTISGNDKKQIIDAQLLATPSGYFKIVDVAALSGKSTLITSNMSIADNSLKFSDTGVYVTSATSLPASVNSAAPVVILKGAVNNLTNPMLHNINIATTSMQTLSIPGFAKSKVLADANITLKGNAFAPAMSGYISLPEVSIPTMKTTLSDTRVNLASKSIDAVCPSIKIDNSLMSAKASISPDFTKGVVVKSVDFKGDFIDSDTLAAAFVSASAPAASNGASASAPADIGVVVQNGKGVVNKFKSGSIIATNLTSDFGLKNNVFYLKNLKGEAFSGKFNGDINVNVLSGKTGVKMTGTGMNAVKAIEGAAAIPNALSGVLGFNANLKLNAFAPSYNSLLKSITGNVSFDVQNGHYANIGRLDNLLLANNLAANVILKTALAPIRNMPVVQNASEFKSINGGLTLNNGIANLNTVKSTGPSMAYFVKGNYNLISGYTNVVILGRLGADVVAALGPLGQLSANKLTSYIPKFGTQTANILNALTSNPASENVSAIPALSSGNTNAKDFKVVFTGNVTSASSIKSFKWLSTCDTSAITGGSLKEQLKNSTDTLKNSGKNTVQDVKKSVESAKETAKTTAEDIKNQVQRTKDSIQDLKNLKNIFKSPSAETAQ